jgi:predicted small lipoprotein YifL
VAMTRRPGRSRVAMLVLLGALAGCGSGGGVEIGPVLSETPPTSAGTPTDASTAPTARPPGPALPSPLQRRDLPPSGIPAAVSSYRADAGAGCYVVRSSPPVDFAAMPGYTDAVDRFCLV